MNIQDVTDLDVLVEFENWFENEVHRTISLKAYADNGEPLDITVYRSTAGYLVTGNAADGRYASGNTHPTLEAAFCNFGVHAERKLGLTLRDHPLRSAP